MTSALASETLRALPRGPATVFERIGELQARGAEGGNGAEEDGGGDRDGKVKPSRRSSRRDIERARFRGRRRPCGVTAGWRSAAKPTPSAPPTRARIRLSVRSCRMMRERARPERLANGKFAGARGGAGEQKIGDVGAGDEQDQRDDGHQYPQRLRELAPQRGEAVGHRSERHMRSSQLVEVLFAEVGIGEAAGDLLQKQVDVGGRLAPW